MLLHRKKAMRITAFLAIVLLIVIAVLSWWWSDRPSLDRYHDLLLPSAESGDRLTLRYFGVTTLVIDDGETTLVIDGFFSRPPLRRVVFGRIEPDRERIRQALKEAGVTTVAAVIPLHTHYDHALDSAEVARLTGAQLVGSASAAQLGRGAGLAESRMSIVTGRETFSFGDFRVTLVPTAHLGGTPAGGRIERPLEPPAHALAWREGRSFGLIIAHPAGRMLIQGGGFVPGSLDGEVVDVALIGTTGQARLGPEYQEDYWQNVVVATGARRVIPVHWDDFTRPLNQGLQPFPRRIADFDQAMSELLERAQHDGVEVRMLPAIQRVNPFEGLDGRS